MNQTRTHRIKTQRRKKRKWLIKTTLQTFLFCLLTGMAIGVYHFASSFSSQLQPDGSVPQTPPDQPQTEHEEPLIRLTFAGDVIMAGNVEKILLEKGYEYPYTELQDLFLQDDYSIVNLETPVTSRGTPSTNKAFVYKSPPAALPALKAAGIDAVNLANNHVMDQGVEGLLDTFAALDENGIAYVGAGADSARAYAPVYVEKNGIRVALFGFSRVVPEVSWYAGKNKPGVAATYDPAQAVQAIREARSKADLIVVIPHWGEERTDFPVDNQKQLARAYIDAGADLVVGGHPHVIQGLESYKEKWIAYSLGNFIFTRSTEPRTWESIVLQASCTKAGKCELRALPFHAELARAVPMNKEKGAALLNRLQSISTDVQIDADGNIVDTK